MNNMIKTAILHAIVALGMQVCIGFYLFYVHGFTIEHGMLAGGFSACSAYLFREMAQHEYKGGGPTKVSGTYGLTHHWTLDSILDILFPLIITGGLWILVELV